MEEALAHFLSQLGWPLLAVVIAAALMLLAKSADVLVDEAVTLSRRSHIPKVIIAATIISLGTTTPEAVVSVLAALQGRPGLALGNAVGSIICDTGLILGLACLIAPLPLNRKIVNRQGWIQVGSGLLLVLVCIPWSNLGGMFTEGGALFRGFGFFFLALLALFLFASVRWAGETPVETPVVPERASGSVGTALAKLATAILLVVAASWILIPAVAEAATRLHVPESIIAATLVAFGTSLPELVTAVTAARQGHGEIAVGNVVGADILNVLFVAGASAAATPGGLAVPPHFFYLYFPSMLFLLFVFRVGIIFSGSHLKRPFGLILVASYLLVTSLSYMI